MKQILPILTLTTLSAAAFADAGAAAPASSGLSYNNITLGYLNTKVAGVSLDGWLVSGSAFIGNSNVVVQASTTIGGDLGNGSDVVSLGYVFKNVGGFADATVSVGSNENYSLVLRKDLGGNLEGQVQYARVSGENDYGVQLAYNFTKSVAVGVGYNWIKVAGVSANTWTAGLRYSF